MNLRISHFFFALLLTSMFFVSSCINQDVLASTHLEEPRSMATELTLAHSVQDNSNDAQPSDSEVYQGLPVGFTEDGYPYIGSSIAQVTLVEFSDYLCPFCGRHFNQTTPTLLKDYGETGLVRFVFREFPIANLHPTAHFGSEAALCAGEQGAKFFWAMHDVLFQRQNQWSSLPDPATFLSGVAEEIEVDMDLYAECVESDRQQSVIDTGIAEAQSLGLTGTPSFQFIRHSTEESEAEESYTLVGAQPAAVFAQWLDALLNGEAPPVEPEPERPELPFWANEDGLQPDPDKPGYTLAGDQYKGSENAPIVVVEFSDFQCPACARHSTEVQPILDETFVNTDDVRWVYKHMPLREHQFAPVAASAAECAAEQDAFWPMHDLLFETAESWSGSDGQTSILDSFEEIFSSEQADEEDAATSTDVQDEESEESEETNESDEANPEDSEPLDNNDGAPSIEDVEAAFSLLADSLELDVDAFDVCLRSRYPLEEVLKDVFDAQGVVQQTPTFVILYDGQGSLLRGARDADQFSTTLEGFVDRAAAAQEEAGDEDDPSDEVDEVDEVDEGADASDEVDEDTNEESD